ncbi:hypothetical protein ENINCP331B_22070 [Enterobacter intestinihominis]
MHSFCCYVSFIFFHLVSLPEAISHTSEYGFASVPPLTG